MLSFRCGLVACFGGEFDFIIPLGVQQKQLQAELGLPVTKGGPMKNCRIVFEKNDSFLPWGLIKMTSDFCLFSEMNTKNATSLC